MFSPLCEFDKKQAILQESNFLIGVDEAGRGPLAGPVVACACFISPSIVQYFDEVNDSKKLTESKREELFSRLTCADNGVVYGVGFATAREIDQLNILQATFLAMRRAAQRFLQMPDSCALIDGPYPVRGLNLKQKPIIDGDAKSLVIASASIIAKVTRDRYMNTLDQLYPGYGFAGHKGYGTAKHLAALRELGPCPEHRRTFGPVRKLLDKSGPLP